MAPKLPEILSCRPNYCSTPYHMVVSHFFFQSSIIVYPSSILLPAVFCCSSGIYRSSIYLLSSEPCVPLFLLPLPRLEAPPAPPPISSPCSIDDTPAKSPSKSGCKSAAPHTMRLATEDSTARLSGRFHARLTAYVCLRTGREPRFSYRSPVWCVGIASLWVGAP